jgi:hypothetical protein
MVQRVSLHPKLRLRYIEPMECRRVATLPQGRDWLYESSRMDTVPSD